MMQTLEPAVDDTSLPPKGGVLQTIEATLSVFFAFLVGFVWSLIGVGMLFSKFREEPAFWRLFPVWAVVMAAEGAFLLWLKWSLESAMPRPFIPEFALRQYRWPLVLRPLAAGWWILHLAPTLGAMWLVERGVSAMTAETKTEIAWLVVLAGFAWILAHCSMMYLLLALTALRWDRALVHFVWRFRLVVDVVVAIALVMVSRGWH